MFQALNLGTGQMDAQDAEIWIQPLSRNGTRLRERSQRSYLNLTLLPCVVVRARIKLMQDQDVSDAKVSVVAAEFMRPASLFNRLKKIRPTFQMVDCTQSLILSGDHKIRKLKI